MPFLVTEVLRKGSLRKILDNTAVALPYGLRIAMARDAARGMAFLHALNPPRVHRDLKVGPTFSRFCPQG